MVSKNLQTVDKRMFIKVFNVFPSFRLGMPYYMY